MKAFRFAPLASVFLALLVAAPTVLQAADITRAEAISRLEQLAAKASLDESHLDLALAAGRVVDPSLDADAVNRQIVAMAQKVRTTAAGTDTPEAGIAALNKVIFQTHGYGVPDTAAPIISGDKALDYYLLHRFVKTRHAHCEGLATLYVLVAQEAGLPVTICNAPIHTYCRYEVGDVRVNVECTAHGSIRPDAAMHTMNGAKPAALGSDVYFRPLTKKQFLSLQINSMAYGLAKQASGPAPLTQKQMVQLAELIEKLDPNRPESLDTAALIHFQAGNPQRAAKIEAHALDKARQYGTTGEILSHFQRALNQYQQE